VREKEKVGGVRLVGGGCLLELRRAESPRSCEGERMVCFEKGVGGEGCRDSDREMGRCARFKCFSVREISYVRGMVIAPEPSSVKLDFTNNDHARLFPA